MGFLLAQIPMRCPSLFLTFFLCGLSFTAQADMQKRFEIADFSGSERLRMFAYGKRLEMSDAPRSVILQMKQNMFSQGFYYEPGGSPLIAVQNWATPVLSYDGNINGGVRKDNFTFNGLVFEADPNFHAKSGFVIGLDAGAVARIAWANGRYVEGKFLSEVVWSPQHSIGRLSGEITLCSRNHVKEWTFIDLCHVGTSTSRELGASFSQETTFGVTELFPTENSFQELTAELSYTRSFGLKQPSITLAWGTIWDRAETKLTMTKAAPIQGESALKDRITATVNGLWKDKPIGIGLWFQRSDGGTFLGTQRVDEATGIRLSYQPSPGVTAQIGYASNHSSINFFDYSQISVNMRFETLRW